MDYDTPPTSDTMNKIFEIKVSITSAYKKVTAVDYVTALGTSDSTNLAIDDYGNTRYIGANPNNYVSIDGELWRIIGVMKDIDDGTGIKEDRIKLIRNESIGNYSWDTSASDVNDGRGVNEWSQADLMKLLNPGYENEEVGGSLYWNNQIGTCYYARNNGTTSCNFQNTGIKEGLKSIINGVVWNSGASSYNKTANDIYIEERGVKNGKICTSGDYCNDNIIRTTTWTGKVGLMYPSDYGYATSGGSNTNRSTCLNTSLGNWSSFTDCYTNNWLYKSDKFNWLLTAFVNIEKSCVGLYIDRLGKISTPETSRGDAFVYPTVYLKSSVKIVSGDGTSDNAFVLTE